ncbi:SDR family NAD(P)-dependent oxidoreductase [Saccharothrix obliqua]|uniref:SDR family NAD(P)-dependent oxidoreductase n=1 Tax=Saccharothrix obliqua TaxID=2861747 RepID=UPI001C5D286C|nr:SDR family oxidoreductase [Saccharothrix obliqua]MBW4717915.1 SDR family oxidoreductase [Saccharothrix obliqua]
MVALVTGGAGGIGGAIAKALAGRGHRVAVADVDPIGTARTVEEFGGLGVHMDVRDAASVRAGVAKAVAELGPLDVLVHAAGVVGGAGPLLSLPVEALDAVLAVNVRGTFLVTQAVGEAMIAARRGGAIVHISSAGSLQPTVGLGHYEATKAAMNALVRSAALELAPHGIRVNAVAPGPVETPLTAAAMNDPAARAPWLERIPLGRLANTDDLVPTVLLLASLEARHITGTVLPIDGGQLLRG